MLSVVGRGRNKTKNPMPETRSFVREAVLIPRLLAATGFLRRCRKTRPMKCPRCEHNMSPAFCNRASGLSYTDPSQFENFVFKDVDLSKAGLRKLIPWKGEWHKAHICEDCSVYVIEYDAAYSRKEIESMLGGMKKNQETVKL